MIWKHLGFNRNIFFVEPLSPSSDDMRLFVGRDEEIKKYLVDVLSDDRALKVVAGDIGVGKTTFVNACQYYTYKSELPFTFKFKMPKILPCYEKIQIRETDTLDDLSIKTTISICQSIAHHCRLQSIEIPETVKGILSHFLDYSISTGGNGISGGVNILGTGAQFGKTKDTKAPSPIKNTRIQLQKLIELIEKELNYKGIFVTVNNLDILPKKKLVDFLNTGRDELFNIKNIYWTLIGRKGIGSIIETEADRVADYLSGTESCISSFDYHITKQIIDKRVETYRRKSSIQCPLTDEAINAFHFLSVQEIRETLHICGEITKMVLQIDPSFEVIPTEVAINTFIKYAYDRAKDIDLSDANIRVLTAVFQRKKCRPKDFEKFGYSTVQGFITALKGLVGKRLLSIEEKGRARIYKMTGMTMIAAITGALGTEIQESAKEVIIQKNGVILEDAQTQFDNAQLELQLDDTNNY